MSDLVDKLRNLGSDLPWEVLDIGWDASEEIERLRALLIEKTKEEAKAHDYSVQLNAEIERLRAGGCARDQTTTQFCAEAVRLQDENARLRDGLRSIAGARPRCCEITDAMQYIARTALAEQEDK